MFFSKLRLKAEEIMEQAVAFLTAKYNQSESVFTVASPFGQLLTVIANISELIFTYISHTAEELNIHTAQNVESIFGLAQLTGHDAHRGGSAFGIIGIKLNTLTDLIEGNYLTIKNFTRLQVTETGQTYFLNLPSDFIRLSKDQSYYTSVHFIQGEVEQQTFTSNGKPLQSFNPIVKSMTDHDNIAVTVNGEEWRKVNSLYDMPADDEYSDDSKCFMAKSSINVGLTIFFGNGNFGKIPPNGSQITVTYVKTAGSDGNADTNILTYNFIDNGEDENGNEVVLNDVLQIETISPPLLGCDYESPEFTKLIAPKTSKSFILSTPESYVNYLSKYNQYSFIYAYNTKDDYDLTDDNITYLKILPNLKKKLGPTQDYFELPTSEFLLTEDEKTAIVDTLDNSGQMLINSEVQIVDLSVNRFIINVIIRYFETANKNTIRTNIRNIFSKYFININRNDIIPLSDLISLVEGVDGVDTCDIFLINEMNENAIKGGSYVKKTNVWKNLQYVKEEKLVHLKSTDDPRLGFDSFGNIIIDENMICIPKGGWTDRDGNYYTEIPETGKLGPLNIFFLDKVEYSAYNQQMQKKLTKILKENY